MKKLLLLGLLFSFPLSSFSQKKVGQHHSYLPQQTVEKQILVDNFEYQIKEVPFAAVRVFIRYTIASWLWQDGNDDSGRAEQTASRAIDDLYENKDEIPSKYLSILRSALLTLLDLNAKDAAYKLREKHRIHQDDESGGLFALLSQKDGERLATDSAIRSIASKSSLEIETVFLIGQLRDRKSFEFFRLLSAVVNALETGRVDVGTTELLAMSGYSTESTVPLGVQRKFLRIVVNQSRSVAQMPGGDFDSGYNLLSLVIPAISTKFPELLQEASTIQSVLKAKASHASIEALERGERIRNSSDKLSAYISEAEQTDNHGLKSDLYISAAHLALKMGKFRYAVDIVEKTAELEIKSEISEEFRTRWRDQFYRQVVDKSLKADDPSSANHAIEKMTDRLAKSDGHRKTTVYYFEHHDPVFAGYSLDEAIKLTGKAENSSRKISSFINLLTAAQKIERARVSALSDLIAKSINAIPTLNVEDKPQTENYKNYVNSVMDINWNLLPALTSLIKENRNEAVNLTNGINKKEIRIIADYVVMTNSVFRMTRPAKDAKNR
ncbi:MAG: hypothetical protein WBD22_08650 [Pyrinomonadaceae bacterium]